MAKTNREKLFTEFPPVSTEQWEEVIAADLEGADYERASHAYCGAAGPVYNMASL